MKQRVVRLPLLALGIVALLGGLAGGLLRLGWALPLVVRVPVAGLHGALMVSGFLGTVIGLERAVALGRPWTYGAPLLTGVGALLIVASPWGSLAPLFMAAGAVVLVAVFAEIVRRQPALFTATMAVAAVAWLVGNALWLAGLPIYRVVLWWLGFLVLTIAGERLELTRLLRLSALRQAAFVVAAAVFLEGLALAVAIGDVGVRVAGAGMIALAAWLLMSDVARRTIRQPGLTRFVALCLLSGYAWLGVGGGVALAFGEVAAGPLYDALLHTVFLGFVFAMIFGHAPIIFPALLGWPLPFHGRFYAHLALLDLSLLLRVGSDLGGWNDGRAWGGLLNEVAVLLFLLSTVTAIATAPRAAAPRRPQPARPHA